MSWYTHNVVKLCIANLNYICKQDGSSIIIYIDINGNNRNIIFNKKAHFDLHT